MRKVNFWSWFLALALAAGIVSFAPALRAQDEGQKPAAQPQQQQQQPAAAQTFTGTVAKTGDKLVLKDMASKTEYQLDDQEKAKAFVGKDVKVTGTLDAQTNTIHVQDIQPSSAG